MKKVFLAVCTVLGALVLFSCGSAPKEKRSLKWNSKQLNSIKDARVLAENWDFKVVRDGILEESSKKETIFFARDEGNLDAVIYTEGKADGYTYGYKYVCVAGEASSTFIVKFPYFSLSLSNTDTHAVLNAGSKKLKNPEEHFNNMIKDRDRCKKFLIRHLQYICVDKVSEAQIAAGAVQFNAGINYLY